MSRRTLASLGLGLALGSLACGDGAESSVGGGAAPLGGAGGSGAAGGSSATTSTTSTPSCEGAAVSAFVGADVVTMTDDATLADQTVIVADGRICALGPRASMWVPVGAEVIEASGKTLLPGLVDSHIHLNFEGDLLLYIAYGVTGVRNMWGTAETLAAREAVRAGTLLGPEIFTTGPIMDGEPPYWTGSVVPETPAEAQASVESQLAAGYDYLKVYSRLSLEIYDAIAAAATSAGVAFVGHVPDAVGLAHVLESGQRSIEHLDGYALEGSDGALEAETAERGVFNCPTLVVFDRYARVDELQASPPVELRYLHPLLVESWMAAVPYAPHPMSAYGAKLMELDGLGAPMAAGTDASNPFVIPGVALHDELELLVAAGLTPFEALRMATLGAAELLAVTDRLGTIEPGKDADLLLVDQDPRMDIAATRAVAGVMVKGAWYSATELAERLEALAEQYADAYNLDFSCELPAEYLAPIAGNSAAFRVKGVMVGPNDASDYVAHEFTVVVDGETLDVGTYAEWIEAGDAAVTLSAFGAAHSLGSGHGIYTYLNASVARDELTAAKAAGEQRIEAAVGTLWIADVEFKESGSDTLYKMCPVAATDPLTAGSSFWVCHESNTEFLAGETLELAGNHALSTDPTVLEDATGVGVACYCWRNQYQYLSCANFDGAG